MTEGKITHFMGRPIDKLSREELREAVDFYVLDAQKIRRDYQCLRDELGAKDAEIATLKEALEINDVFCGGQGKENRQLVAEIVRLRAELTDLIDAGHRCAFTPPMQLPHRHDDLVKALASARAALSQKDAGQ
jgi:hypothetical protein